MRSTSPVGSLPASGSCDSRRMVVSTISGMSRWDLTVALDARLQPLASHTGTAPGAVQAREM